MLFKQTWVSVSDNTNVRWLRLFHLYKGFNRKVTTIGYFVKGSVRKVEPPRVEYKGFKFKFNLKGDICRGLVIRTRKTHISCDGSFKKFKSNNVVLIKKKQQFKSKYLYGPVPLGLKRKKILTLFKLTI